MAKTPGRDTPEYKTFSALVRSGVAARARNHSEAHAHYDLARKYHKEHIDSLSHAEQHEAITQFKTATEPLFKKLERMLSTIAKPKKTGIFKSEYGRKAGYDYKPFHELSDLQQMQARKHFGGPHESYHYPIAENGTDLAVGVTRFQSPMSAPQANEPYTPQNTGIHAHHSEGSLVYIQNPKHEDHGIYGRVTRKYHPMMPGKLAIEVHRPGKTSSEVVWADSKDLVPKKEFRLGKAEKGWHHYSANVYMNHDHGARIADHGLSNQSIWAPGNSIDNAPDINFKGTHEEARKHADEKYGKKVEKSEPSNIVLLKSKSTLKRHKSRGK